MLLLGLVPAAGARTSLPDFVPFDTTAGEYPEGVAVDKVGNVFVSMDRLGQVWRITPAGRTSVVADFTTDVDAQFQGPGAVGLAVNAQGDVYVARGAGGGLFKGVWRIDRKGRAAPTLVPGTQAIALPNALAFDKQGNLFVTETFSLVDPVPYACAAAQGGILPGFGDGSIWRVPRGGEAQLWLRSELLTGSCTIPIPYPVGANGISYRQGAVFVANTEKATVLRIPIRTDGSAGTPAVLATVSEPIDPNFGPPVLDGTAIDVHGNVYVAVVNQSRIVRIPPEGSPIETVASLAAGNPLDFPTSMAFGTGRGERRTLFTVNAAIAEIPALPGPALVKLHLDVPGMPLP